MSKRQERILSKRQALTKLLRRLNQHYGMHVHIHWQPEVYFATFSNLRKGTIEIIGDERILDPQVLAHEYAHYVHFITEPESLFKRSSYTYKSMHPEAFFKHYREVCQVMGILPVVSSLEACLRYMSKHWIDRRWHVIEDGQKRSLSEFAQCAVNYLEQHPVCDEVVQYTHNIIEMENAGHHILGDQYPDSPTVYHQLPEGYKYDFSARGPSAWVIGVKRGSLLKILPILK